MKKFIVFLISVLLISWLSLGIAEDITQPTTNIPAVTISVAQPIVPATTDAHLSQIVVATDELDINTAEINSPIKPPDADQLPGLVNQLVPLVKQRQWPAAIAMFIVILMGVLKLDFMGNLLGKYVPKRLMPAIPVLLGVVAGTIYGYISGGWQQAAQVVLESGVIAIFLHNVLEHSVIRKDKVE